MIGFGPEHDARCADILVPPDAGEAAMGRGTNTRAWRAAEIPAANGHGTATAIARVYSALSRGGEVDGIKVLSADAIDRAIVHQVPRAADGSEGAAQFPFGLGYMLIGKFPGLTTSAMAGSRVFGHPGAGGSIGLADPDEKIGFGYVMSQMQSGMTGGAHGFRLLAAVYASLG